MARAIQHDASAERFRSATMSRSLALLLLGLLVLPLVQACSSSESAEHDAMEQLWSLKVGDVKLEQSKDLPLGEGNCKTGTVSGLHVDLCVYKDALSADAARELGLDRVGSDTGAALVRDRLLLVIADRDKVDAHGKKLNTIATLFLKPNA